MSLMVDGKEIEKFALAGTFFKKETVEVFTNKWHLAGAYGNLHVLQNGNALVAEFQDHDLSSLKGKEVIFWGLRALNYDVSLLVSPALILQDSNVFTPLTGDTRANIDITNNTITIYANDFLGNDLGGAIVVISMLYKDE